MSHGINIAPDGTTSIRTFITLPEMAKATGIGEATLAWRMSAHGLTPDGVVHAGRKRFPIFESSRVSAFQAALGSQPN